MEPDRGDFFPMDRKTGMKVQCPQCREIIEMERFSTSEEGLKFSCPECNRQNFLPNPARVHCEVAEQADAEKAGPPRASESRALKKEDSLQAATSFHSDSGAAKGIPEKLRGKDEVVCPKCGHAQADSESCHSCGLSFDLFDPAKLPPDPPEAVEIWRQVALAPEDRHLHDCFVDACSRADRLDYAHRRYRIFERETGMTDVAEAMRYRIQDLAQVQMGAAFDMSPQTVTDNPARRRLILWIIVSIIGLSWIGYIVMDSLGMLD